MVRKYMKTIRSKMFCVILLLTSYYCSYGMWNNIPAMQREREEHYDAQFLAFLKDADPNLARNISDSSKQHESTNVNSLNSKDKTHRAYEHLQKERRNRYQTRGYGRRN